LLQATLRSSGPVAMEDYGERLGDEGPGLTGTPMPVASAVAAIVPGPDGPAGVLAAYSTEPRDFVPTEASFMQSVAHVLSEAIERRRVEEETRHRALHDHLTGRPNRLLFTERLEAALERTKQGGSQLAIFFLDIDNFKLVNDGFGHSAGDELLKALGPRLRRGLVMTDTVARFGGDEFAVLCEDVRDAQHAREIAEQIRAALDEPFAVGGGYRASASIGIALSADAQTAEELIAQADAAMYLAKEQTRGGHELFDEAMRTGVRTRFQFENALRAAIERDELHLAVQPIVSLPAGAPVGAELLLRWESSELGRISPAEFIPVAEQTGAIIPVGGWVIARAFELASRWRSAPGYRRYLPLHINVSARQLAQRDFADLVRKELSRTGARVRDLSFEITEHALLGGDAGTASTLEELQGMGFAIVLDDFGTGYSSLSHLKQFPIDMVKIDQLFVSNLTDERKDEAIISAVIGMADAFALDIVAEGIETAEQASRLTELGCPYGQGFLFARPQSVEGMEPHRPQRRRGLQLVESPTARSASSRVE
jgi:diguanylate cyclase (GGDEF)-like protein